MDIYTCISNEQQVPQAILKQLGKIEIDPTDRHSHVSFVMYGKRIVSVGRNSYSKTHTMQAKYATMVGETKKRNCLHAEIASLVKIRGKADSIYVFRVTKSGKWLNSRPCNACALAIQESGLKCFHS